MTDAEVDIAEDNIPPGTVVTTAGEFKPWTIKGMPDWVIRIARDAAKAERLSMGQWLTKIIPVAAKPNGAADREAPPVPAVLRPKAALAVAPGPTEVSQVAEAADIAKQLSTIEGLPRSVVKEAHGLLRDRLRAARRG